MEFETILEILGYALLGAAVMAILVLVFLLSAMAGGAALIVLGINLLKKRRAAGGSLTAPRVMIAGGAALAGISFAMLIIAIASFIFVG